MATETIIEQRAAAVKAAEALVAGVKGETLNAAQTAELQRLTEQVKGFDAHIATSKKDQALLQQVKNLGSFDDQGAGGYLGMTGVKARDLAQSIARSMRGDDREFGHNPTAMKAGAPAGTKSLSANGAVTVGVPLVSSPVEQGRPAQSLLDVLQHVVRPPVYKINVQKARTNNAAVVAPGGLKPTSVYGIEDVQKKLETIAHVSEPMDNYQLANGVDLTRFLEMEMLYGLRVKLEDMVLNGAGVDDEFTGILKTSGVQTQAFDTDLLTSTRAAKTKLDMLGYIPGVYVISPLDWQALELQRNASGAFDLTAGPVESAERRLWGTPVVVSNALPPKSALLLDTAQVTVDTDGFGVQTKWSEATGEDFMKNQTRVRVEGQYGVSLFHPQSAVKIATAA
ncbi:phage major capsid protein [Rhodococcus sp. MTM3W5.2]|uniref:phage major capsid protein n=1 Tax=Rhodococcus sp. MTM3W5.2 TaxID=1805827 RepID=UPI00097C593F|nr:phage major capsid protein [Rhodococcus sp. MTM3W5.2]